MIDFDALVLKQAGDIFQIMVSYTPTVSQPGAPAFDTFGVYSSSPIDVNGTCGPGATMVLADGSRGGPERVAPR